MFLILIFDIDGDISQSVFIFFQYFLNIKEAFLYNVFHKILQLILQYHLDAVELSCQTIVIFFYI